MTYRNLGTPSWIFTFQVTYDDNSSMFFYSDSIVYGIHQWGINTTIPVNTWSAFNYGNNYSYVDESEYFYYSFIFKDVADGVNSEGYVMETSAEPVTLTIDGQSPPVQMVSDDDTVLVSFTLSAAPCAEEHVYLRYSTDSWVTSSIVEATLTGATGEATIPAQAAEATVEYYIFTTTINNPTSGYDLLTLNYDNNSGSNYSYDAQYGTTNDGNWNSAATWKAGHVPPTSGNVIIKNAVTVTNEATSPAECNNLTIYSLTSAGAGSLTILPGKALIIDGDLIHDVPQ